MRNIRSNIMKNRYYKSEILYLNTHDSLTGLLNRKSFEIEVGKIDSQGEYPISVIIADINGLKIVNEVFGFDAGNQLIKKTARSLALNAGNSSKVARWGGDEFAIVLPGTDESMVEEICGKIIISCSKIEESCVRPSIALGNATKKSSSEKMGHILSMAENRMYRKKLLETQSAQSSIITSLNKALYEKSFETEEHAQRMYRMSIKIGNALGLSRDELDELCLLSVLHDIGKIGISDKILLKPEKLSEDEWKEMKKHSEIGYHIACSSNELSIIAEYILTHHERWDGKGYPQGLKGKEIPKLSQIISIVDTYDVITNERPYKAAMSHKEAIEEIRRCSGTQFAPDIADVFCNISE